MQKRGKVGFMGKIRKKLKKTEDCNIKNEKLLLAASLIFSFALSAAIIQLMWPLHSWLEFGYLAVYIAFAVCVSAFIIRSVFPCLFSYIMRLFGQHDACRIKSSVKNNTESQHEFKNRTPGVGPQAEVGIRYFIEREKNMEVYNAEYLGPV